MSDGIGKNIIGMKMWNREVYDKLKNNQLVCLIE